MIPTRASDLTNAQLRHLLLVRLHASVGVDAWGASREELLALAKEGGVDYLSTADLEEVGPAERQSTAKYEADLKERMRLRKQNVGLSPSAKLWAQMILLTVILLAQGGWIPIGPWKNKRKQPAPRICPPPRWWQRPLPSKFQPGGKGECVRDFVFD